MTVSEPAPRTHLDPASLEALEDQRDFLLQSLEDLERELAAGDVDAHDYLTLKDDYTARAAVVIRSIEAGRARASGSSRRRPLGRAVLTIAGVVAFAVLAGVLVTQAAGRRDASDTITGDIRQSATEKLNEAGRLGSQGQFEEAIDLYDEVLAEQPANVEALTYKGWMQTLSGEQQQGLSTLITAATTDRRYPDVHAFLAVVFFRSGLVDEAARELERLDELDPPASVRQLTEGLRAEIEAAQADSSTTTTTPAS